MTSSGPGKRRQGPGWSSRCSTPSRKEPMSATDAPTSVLRPLVEELHERRRRIEQGGGPEKIEKQHAAEKLTARERLALLIDPGTWNELGIHGRPHFSQRAM